MLDSLLIKSILRVTASDLNSLLRSLLILLLWPLTPLTLQSSQLLEIQMQTESMLNLLTNLVIPFQMIPLTYLGNVINATTYHADSLVPTDVAFNYTTRPKNGVTLSGFVNVPTGQKGSSEFLVKGQVSKQLHPQVVLTISAAVIPPVLSSRPSASFAYEFEVYSA